MASRCCRSRVAQPWKLLRGRHVRSANELANEDLNCPRRCRAKLYCRHPLVLERVAEQRKTQAKTQSSRRGGGTRSMATSDAEAKLKEASASCASTDEAAIREEETRGAPTAPVRISFLPARYSKVIYFVRHGEGFHNLAGHLSDKNYLNPAYFDAHLTAFGWQQAEALKRHIAAHPEIKPEVVIVSPLTRAIETAIGVFGGSQTQEADKTKLLMPEQEQIPDKVAAHGSVSSRADRPFVAWEGCREHIGMHPCDRRRSTEYYQEHYPAIDFSLVAPGEDTLWKTDHRESREEIKKRGLAFVEWLLQRPERRIAVGELHRWFENCEMRTVVVSDSQGSGSTDSLWFPGGKSVQSN